MRAGVVSVIGCLVAALTACSSGTTPHAQSGSPSPTGSSPSAKPTEAPLPAGYIRLDDTAGLLSLGVPRTWYHAKLDSNDPALARLTHGTGVTATRWKAFATSGKNGGVFAASDPLSTDAVLVIERNVGVDVTDLTQFDHELRSGLAKAGVVRSSSKIQVNGKHGLRYLFDYHDSSGAVVHEVLDFFDVNGTIIDLTFTGAPAAIAAVTATVSFPAG
ncbi:MAG: hypothetical protein QOD07_749 [Frankiaceae bacterium]|jgi:hypothetical protein|nr:hypothetical protein [Frankiaceae bacterium]